MQSCKAKKATSDSGNVQATSKTYLRLSTLRKIVHQIHHLSEEATTSDPRTSDADIDLEEECWKAYSEKRHRVGNFHSGLAVMEQHSKAVSTIALETIIKHCSLLHQELGSCILLGTWNRREGNLHR